MRAELIVVLGDVILAEIAVLNSLLLEFFTDHRFVFKFWKYIKYKHSEIKAQFKA